MGDHFALFVPFSGFSFAQAIQIMGLDDWCVCKLGCFRKKRDDDEPEDTLCDGSERWTALLSFFIFGLINNFAYVVFLTGAESFLPGQSALVLLAEMLPTLIVQGIAPLFVERIPFWMRISYITLTACLAFFLVAFFTQTALKFVGIVVASISCGLGEITFMALSTGYHKNTVSMYSSGTGGAGIVGSVTWLALNTWLNLEPTMCLYICLPFPLLMGLAYFCILPAKREKASPLEEPINSNSEDMTAPLVPQQPTPMTTMERIKFQIPLFKYTGPLFLVYFSEYLINQGLFTAIRFPFETTIPLASQYAYYQTCYQVGVFISRSSVNVIQIKALWFMAFWQVANFVFLFCVAYFKFIPSVWIIMAIVLYEGLLGGAVYVNGFYLASEEIPADKKEFGMSSISVWYSIAILLAGVAALFLAPWIGPPIPLEPLVNATNETGIFWFDM